MSFQGKLPGKARRLNNSGVETRLENLLPLVLSFPLCYAVLPGFDCALTHPEGYNETWRAREILRFCCYDLKTLLKIRHLSLSF